MEIVKLKNGIETPRYVVATIISALENLLKPESGHGTAFFDLVSKCRDENYKIFGINEEKLKYLGLVQSDGTVHQSIKEVVLVSVEVDGLDMKLVNPIAGD